MELTINRRSLALLAFMLTLFLSAGGAVAVVAQGADIPQQAAAVLDQHHPRIQVVMTVQDRHTDFLLGQPGVVGTATGLAQSGRPAVLVLIESFGAARTAAIPAELDGVPVAVKITGKIKALAKGGTPGPPGGNEDSIDGEKCTVDTTARFDHPVPIGVSTGHPDITAGTIGARVTDGNTVYALSNNHVYANENSADIGDNVLQPGPFDGGIDTADVIGTLAGFVTIDFSTSANNTVDAAIASTQILNLGNATPCDGYGTPKAETASPSINLKVTKYGRTTGETNGQITAINATVNIGYDSGTARFVNQIIIEPGNFSAGGDSGSLIVVNGKGKAKADDRKPVGLLFAGSFFVTIANPIDTVLDEFGVTIDGE